MATATVILCCPCCVTPQDAVTHPENLPQEFRCHVCGQRWVMVVDAARHFTFSLS